MVWVDVIKKNLKKGLTNLNPYDIIRVYQIKQRKEEKKMRADVMRKITEDARKVERAKEEKRYDLYVDRLVDSKVRRIANKGFARADVKIPTKFAPTKIKMMLEAKGFEVTEKRVNGRSEFAIKW